MKSTLLRGIEKAINLVATILFVFVFGACTDQHIAGIEEPDPVPVVPGDSIPDFSSLKFEHDTWTYANGLAKSEPWYYGYVTIKDKSGNILKEYPYDKEIAPMTISWEPIEETTSSSAQKPFMSSSVSKETATSKGSNQGLAITEFERTTTFKFVGKELVIKGTWGKRSLKGADAEYCRYDSTQYVTQVSDTAKVDGNKIEIVIGDEKYNRVNVTVKTLNHFSDFKNGVKASAHTEKMDIPYSTLVPVNFTPGEKIYEGSTGDEKTGVYTFIDRSVEGSIIITRFKSQMELEHYESQDGNLQKSKTTESGIAISKYWVEEKGPKLNLLKMFSGNPTSSFESSVSDLYLKEGFIYAKKYTTVWTYTWAEFNYEKKVYNETEVLYYMREEGKEVAMPFGEATTSWKEYVAGTSTEKSEGNKKYDAYPNGVLYFNGLHTSKTGNLKYQIEGLQVGQEFWVEKEEPKDEFIDFDVKIIPAEDNNGTSQIIITENWTISGKKTFTYSQRMDYTFEVSDLQRVYGESLNFESGLTKSANDPAYTPVSDAQYVRKVTTTYTAKFDLCSVKGFAGMTEGYVLYRNKKYHFEAKSAEVEYKGINNPTATEIEEGVNKYMRKAYEVTFNHSVIGNKAAKVNVDKLVPPTPDMPDEMGPVDITKTKQFGRLSWAWDANGKEFISATIVTAYGVVSVWNGGYCFTKMTTAEIKDKLGNSLCPENASNYLIPSYITIENKPNKHWVYTDVNGKGRDEIYGTLIEKLEDVSLNEPFFGTPSETSETYQIIDQEGSTRIRVVYKGTVLFDHVFAK